MPDFTWTSERVARALGVSAEGRAAGTYSGISTDSRSVRPGELFVALRGARYDGGDFVAAAREAGAVGAVVERRPAEAVDDLELFLVDDALEALGRLAAARRRALDPRVIGITGTSGKTTTRELTAAAIGPDAYASPGNFNNLVGLPLSVLAAPETRQIWVLEIASNQPGEVGKLARVAAPNYGVITAVGAGHLEGLGDLAGVMEEKLTLLDALPRDGLALVADEPPELVERARERCSAVRGVGLSEAADERPERWSQSTDGVEWVYRGVEFRLSGFGTHLIRDALFAVSLAGQLRIDLRESARRLGDFRLPPMRGEVRRLDGLTLVIDCYNANPSSFAAAIESLQALASGRRRAVLAGTMLELGVRSAELHGEVARRTVQSGVEVVAAVGEFAAAFEELGERPSGGLIIAEDLEAAYRALAAHLRGNEAVLLKASRGMRFERAIPWFERDFGRAKPPEPGTEG